MKLFVILLALVTCTAAVDAQENSTPAIGQDETGTVTGKPSMLSTLTAGKIKRELTTESPPTVEAATTETIHTSSTRSTVRTSTKRPSRNRETSKGVEQNNYQGIFKYDEKSLRKWGLVAAAILFILGILILTCGKHGKILRCRGKKRARNYDVTQG